MLALNGDAHLAIATAAWNALIAKAGMPENTRVHARELFHGHARAKTPWRMLTEPQVAKLSVDLIRAVAVTGIRFFLGVVYKDTYPAAGVPAGLDETGRQLFVKFTSEHGYAFAFAAAAHLLSSGDVGVLRPGIEYTLHVDPQSSKVRLWGHTSMQVRSLIEATGLKPTDFTEKPSLLDAADLFAYAATRKIAGVNARNRDACESIYEICSPVLSHFWWNPENEMSPIMRQRLGLK
jgi:hypothetical protein